MMNKFKLHFCAPPIYVFLAFVFCGSIFANGGTEQRNYYEYNVPVEGFRPEPSDIESFFDRNRLDVVVELTDDFVSLEYYRTDQRLDYRERVQRTLDLFTGYLNDVGELDSPLAFDGVIHVEPYTNSGNPFSLYIQTDFLRDYINASEKERYLLVLKITDNPAFR